jgi:hypothetical protein
VGVPFCGESKPGLGKFGVPREQARLWREDKQTFLVAPDAMTVHGRFANLEMRW